MKFDLCVPVYRNLECLRVSIRGLLSLLSDRKSLEQVILHVQDPTEESDIVSVFNNLDIEPVIASRGPEPTAMSDILNRLCAAARSEWSVFSEQDVFPSCAFDSLVEDLDRTDYIVAGPVDTFHYTNSNARNQPLYGQYGRLSPEPGYYHSSLIALKNEAVSGIVDPFSLPEGFRLHGYGVLGGESYYGLRVKIGDDRRKLAFFTQKHSSYGYAAKIEWGDQMLATHLYYSSTKKGYVTDGFLRQDEFEWLEREESRFLRDYQEQL